MVVLLVPRKLSIWTYRVVFLDFKRYDLYSAAQYLLEDLSSNSASRRIGGIAGHLGAPITISVGGVNISLSFDGSAPAATDSSSGSQSEPRPTEANTGPEPKGEAKPQKEYTLADVGKHNTDKDCWVVVNGQVLDVTDFLKDHPGGKKAIMLYAGRDATEECEYWLCFHVIVDTVVDTMPFLFQSTCFTSPK